MKPEGADLWTGRGEDDHHGNYDCRATLRADGVLSLVFAGGKTEYLLEREGGGGGGEGSIEFLGLWRDTGDRAMPIKMNVNPGNPNQVR